MNILHPIKQTHRLVHDLMESLLGLIYPKLCCACGTEHPIEKQHLCISCRITLPMTDYHIVPNNGVTNRIEGRFPFQAGTAMYYFIKDSPVQHLLHRIKYGGQKHAALEIGRVYGNMLNEVPLYQSIDAIVPVPLHPSRQHSRGYNQSEWFALGLQKSMEKPVYANNLVRIKPTLTQTKMNRSERIKNLTQAFTLKNPSILEGKHILLVDDVLTTGATLEFCANTLLTPKEVKVSLATIAIAQL